MSNWNIRDHYVEEDIQDQDEIDELLRHFAPEPKVVKKGDTAGPERRYLPSRKRKR